MMKLLMMLIMLIPLSFILNYWDMKYMLNLLVMYLILKFNSNYIFNMISYNLGYDLLSYSLILLSLWICMLMILASEKLYKMNNYYNFFMFLNVILLISLILVFSALNLFIFYLFFEISLIPVLMMILGWGYQPERIQAGVYLLFYTLLASLPMMISIFYCYKMMYSLEFFYFQFFMLNNWIFYFFMNMVFFIKLPMYFIHLWLPKAHVEAPIAGSMILAGIMLKLGGYGLMRLMMIFMKIGVKINMIFIIISLVGGVIISLMCVCQSDLKSLIAYSSVAHMGLVLSGVMTMNYWGLVGSLMMMLAHGLCSSGLFCLANINYERLESRSIYINKGLINILPSLSLWWFLFCACNMAAPPSLNLLSEIILLNSILVYSKMLIMLLMFLSFFSAVYSLFLFSFTQHGNLMSSSYNFMSINIREYLLLFLHYIPLNFLILKSEIFLLWL